MFEKILLIILDLVLGMHFCQFLLYNLKMHDYKKTKTIIKVPIHATV